MEKSLFNVIVPLKNEDALIYNSISKAIVRIQKSDRKDYENNDFSDSFYPTWLLLKQHYMLTQSAYAQKDALETSDKKSKKLNNHHLSLTLMMSESCNFACSYCNQGLNKNHTKLSKETVVNVCNYIESQKTLKSVHISWYGGEPLLSFDLIKEYSYLLQQTVKQNQLKYEANIITNGYFLTSYRAKQLVKFGVSIAQVTLDGDKVSHDKIRFSKADQSSYDIIMSNIEDVLNETKLHIVLRVNVTLNNIDNLYHLVDDINDRGIQDKNISIYFASVYDPQLSNINDAMDVTGDLVTPNRAYALKELDLLKYADRIGLNVALDIDEHEGDCLVTRSNSFAISPDGNLFKCYIPITNKDYSVGHTTHMLDAFSNELFQRWDSWSAFKHKGCKQCKLLGSCRGGCPLHFVSEDHKDLGSHCPTSKYAFNEHLFRRALKLGIVSDDDWDLKLSKTHQKNLSFHL